MTSDMTKSPSKILLVDDERSIRITLGEFLRDAEYEVETAEDADQAMEMLSRDDFDVVVTDIIMPRITGVKLLEAIRESAPRVQVILMTGEPTVETASKAVRADAFDYLTKPIGKGELIRTVSNAMMVKTLDDERRRLVEENLRYQENLEQLVEQRTRALGESEELLRDTFDGIQDGIIVLDLDLNIMRANFWMEKMYEAYMPFIGKKCYEVYQQRETPCPWCPSLLTLETGETHSEIVPYPSAENPKGWLNLSAYPLRDTSGQIIGVIESAKDISEQVQAQENLKKYTSHLETLNTVTAALSTSLELEKVLELILDQIEKVIPFDSGAIFLHEEEGVRVMVDRGIVPSAQGRVFSAESPLFREIEQTRVPLALSDIRDDDRFLNWGQSENIETWMGVPLIVRDTLIGFCTLDSFQPNAYSLEQANLALSFAAQAAQAIDNARQFEIITARNTELLSLYKTSQQLQHLDTPEALAQNIIRFLEKILNYEHGAIFLLDKDSSQLIPFALSDRDQSSDYMKEHKAYLISGNISLEEGVVGWVARNGQSLRLGDVRKDSRYLSMRDDIRSELCVPLKVRKKVIGVANVETTRLNAYSDSDQRLLETVASQIAISIQNAQLLEEIKDRIAWLDALHKIDQAITSSLDLKSTLNLFLSHLREQMQVDAATVLLYQQELQSLTFCQGQGFQTVALQHTNLRLGRGLAGKVALNKKAIFISDLSQTKSSFSESGKFKQEDFRAYYGIPLTSKDELVGVLEIFHRSPLNPDNEWISFLQVLAGQATIAIDNTALYDGLLVSHAELALAYDETIEGWAHALELRDMETEGHSRRVVTLTMELAKKIGINETRMTDVYRGALLHDIGKMGVPDAILQKPGKLTDDEWEIMRLHPVYAYEWLSEIDYLRPALDIPYYHHERWDGTGYPSGLKGEEIPIAARVFAIVDVWDALRSDRPYRKAWSREKTLSHIQAESGKHFDPQVVTVFIEHIGEEGNSP